MATMLIVIGILCIIAGIQGKREEKRQHKFNEWTVEEFDRYERRWKHYSKKHKW